MHVSGAKLDQYTGIAAILRFPLQIPDDHRAVGSGDGVTSSDVQLHSLETKTDDSDDDVDQRCIDGFADMGIFSAF
jgi:hypothetical protein